MSESKKILFLFLSPLLSFTQRKFPVLKCTGFWTWLNRLGPRTLPEELTEIKEEFPDISTGRGHQHHLGKSYYRGFIY
jgi:hypothetical protein